MKVCVVGSGSWGTALAQVAASNGNAVTLWARRCAVAFSINCTHKNPDYLQEAVLLDSIRATTDLKEACQDADALLLVTPSAYLRETVERLKNVGLSEEVPVALCSKGVEAKTGLLPVQISEEVLKGNDRFAALAGPNHAEEVIAHMPSATVVASTNEDIPRFFQDLLGSSSFRVYSSTDIVGVELCAAFKNVIAIIVGVAYGLGYGDNTAAMLMTRGQAEMGRLVKAAGGDSLTCMGLAGTGDLIATCMSQHSRNRTFGEALAQGISLAKFEKDSHMVVEGAQACITLRTLSDRLGVELPLTDVVRNLVWDDADPSSVATVLAAREMKPEFY